jgi:hypothetical protein
MKYKKTKALLILGTIALLVSLFLWPKQVISNKRIELVQDKVEQKDEKTITKPDAMELWLDRLEDYECRDCGPKYRRVDSNGLYSHGCLQFQERTFDEMWRRYRTFEVRDVDSDQIYSCEIQRQLARSLFEDEGVKAARHWYHSIYTRGLGLPPL